MSKFGIIFCGFNTQGYIESSLNSWVLARQGKLGGDEFYIVAVSLPFKDFPLQKRDNTRQILQQYKDNNLIDELIIEPEFITEVEARTLALKKIISNNCDYNFMVDSDEFYHINQIDKIIKFIKFNNLVTWFRISYRNFVFDTNTYLVEPFTPPRIHKIKIDDNIIADSFYDDNNILYKEKDSNVLYQDRFFSNMVISSSYEIINHYCWISDSRSKDKVNYQKKRGWNCSYDWDDKNNCLIFNTEYFKKVNLPIPKVAKFDSTLKTN